MAPRLYLSLLNNLVHSQPHCIQTYIITAIIVSTML